MGVLNVTPDSFSDGGRWASTDAAIEHGLELAQQGADIVDVGGESTRPGAERVPVPAELGRVLPVVRELASGQIVGTTRYHDVDAEVDRVEIGYTWYAKRWQRSHVNTTCKLMLLTHAFEVLGCHCVQLRTDWLNRASRRAIERLGAKQDGVLRGHMVLGDRLRDTVVYSILAHEWPGVRRNLRTLLAAHEEQPR